MNCWGKLLGYRLKFSLFIAEAIAGVGLGKNSKMEAVPKLELLTGNCSSLYLWAESVYHGQLPQRMVGFFYLDLHQSLSLSSLCTVGVQNLPQSQG